MALEIPALGRPFTLGMLYDCREEKIIPGITLWNREDLARNIIEKSQKGTDFEVLTSDSLSDKSSALNISGALKISLWSGMIDIEGSGKYLTDTKESEKQARVTLQYKRTTKFEQLAMNHLSYNNITYQEVFDKGVATHVVTGILYGAQAFFVFDQKVTNSEKVKDVQGKLQVMVTKIGDLTVNMGMNSTKREEVRQFSCKFHGDFALEKNPVTYEEAVEIYASLPSLLGENGEMAVPMKVWLYPLINLDSRAARLVREIRDHLVFRVEDIMQQMLEVVMECNDMMGHPAAQTFPALANKILQFRKLFERFRVMYQKQLSKALPSVRGGNMEESSLEDILLNKEKSPFSDQNIRRFLDRRWTEMEYVQSILTRLASGEDEGRTFDFKIVVDPRELRRELLNSTYFGTVCFNFHLDYKDLYLSHLESWIQRELWDFQDIFSDGEAKEWYEQDEISEHVKYHIYHFLASALEGVDTEFLITSFVCRAGLGIHQHFIINRDMGTHYCTCEQKPAQLLKLQI
ncbi:verrucotoxin subunit beta-like [Dendropsophus ebraccatus]|uniref:verrucotoxin subunit beta-like n=1 Tax=Dendropsophus ebraccatus TaxID=150705 RepID=UPI003831A827